jgi:hypothetical protein
MTFKPQYGFWAKDTLTETGGAIYSNPDRFFITDGATVMIPDNYTGNTFSYNGGPWVSPPFWCIENKLDTWSDISSSIGHYTGITGSVSFLGNLSGQGVVTEVPSMLAGWGPGTAYPTGAIDGQYAACLGVGGIGTSNWPCPDGGAYYQQTYEFEVRTYGENASGHSLSGLGLSGMLRPSFFASNSNDLLGHDEFIIIEPLLDGVRVHNKSGAFLPVNLSGAARKMRIGIEWGGSAKGDSATDVIVSLSDGTSLYVKDCAKSGALATDHTAIWGCPPMFTGASTPTFSSDFGASTFFDLSHSYDEEGLTGIAGFTGKAMWDNVKLNLTGLYINEPELDTPSYASITSETIRTPEWTPNKSMQRYVGAWITSLPGSGNSSTNVDIEYKYPSDIYGGTGWQTHSEVSPVIISGLSSLTSPSGLAGSYYIDMSSIPVYPAPFENSVRFLITATPNGNQPPSIDEIFTIGQPTESYASFHPNWKMSSLPQGIQVSVNEEVFLTTPPNKHIYDDVYIENESNLSGLAIGSPLSGVDQEGNVSGEIKSILFPNGLGVIKSDNGFYKNPVWRNFQEIESFTGLWYSPAYTKISTGVYQGDLLDSYTYHPTGWSDEPYGGTTGIASVNLDVVEFETVNGDTLLAQYVDVYSFTGSSSDVIGIQTASIGINTGASSAIGVIEGVIEIPYGRGVWATIHEGATEHKYFLDGSHYRTPGSFSIAAHLDSDRSSVAPDVHASFGFPARSSVPAGLDSDKWGEWTTSISRFGHDQFVLYGLTGRLVDHSYFSYSGITGYHGRTTALDDTLDVLTGSSFSTFTGFNYGGVESDCFIFEGHVKPYGLTGAVGSSGLIASCNVTGYNPSSGLVGQAEIWLHSDGHIAGQATFAVCNASYGRSGFPLPTGIGANYALGSNTYSFEIDGSKGPKIAWGQWNHIGFAMEQLVMGDTYSGFNQPLLIGDGDKITHGARSSKCYLTLNNEVAGVMEIGPNTRASRLTSTVGVVHGVLPTGANSIASQTWPTINTWAPALNNGTLAERELIVGRDIVGEWDHFRFGVRDRLDLYSDVIIEGGKSHSPTFTPDDGLKVITPISGDYGHMEYAHIFRLDYGTHAPFWDEGYAPCHLRMYDYDNLSGGGIEGYNMKSKDFISQIDGPKGRPAVRLGPGAGLRFNASRWDENMFNGTGSYHHRETTLSISTLYTGALQQLGDTFEKTNANSCFVWGAYVKPFAFPTGEMIADIFAMDLYDTDNLYGHGQAFLGFNSIGELVFGTRVNSNQTHNNSFGPFTGGLIETGSWTHIGLESRLHYSATQAVGDPGMDLYVDGQLELSVDLSTTATSSSAYSGVPFGMPTGVNSPHAIIRIGGSAPVTGVTPRSFRWDYTDIGISEAFMGYKTVTGDRHIDFARLATASGSTMTGHAEKVFSDYTDQVSTVYGAGSLYTGVFIYPATSFDEAGIKMLWVTAAGGNSWEGLLKGGMALFGDGTFVNGQSYYATYDDSSSDEVLGGTDSPIQFVNKVPPHAINLALISSKGWNSDMVVSLFDMSDNSYANVTHQSHNDLSIGNFTGIDQDVDAQSTTQWTGLVSDDIYGTDIRVSSYAIDGPTAHIGYFAHLIGGEERGVYINTSTAHINATGDTGNYLNNLDRIRQSIQIRKENGNSIPFEDFPYDIIATPYSPLSDMSGLAGNDIIGFGTGYNSSEANADNVFTVILIAEHQTIDKTVFIHYPSKEYEDGTINLQASDIYNPIPLMKEQVDVVGLSGEVSPKTGGFSVTNNGPGKGNMIYIWGGNLDV